MTLALLACAEEPPALLEPEPKAYATATSLSGADALITGYAAHSRLGESLAFEDLDADGLDELIVGARSQDNSRGAVWVVWGDALGDLDLSEWVDDPSGAISGEVTQVASNAYSNVDYFGWDVAALGDGSVAASSPGGDLSSARARGAGYVHVLDGTDSTGARLGDHETAGGAADSEIIGGPTSKGNATTKCDYNGVAWGGSYLGATQVAVGCPMESAWGTYDGAIYWLDASSTALQNVRADAHTYVRGPDSTAQAQVGARGTYAVGDLDGDGNEDDLVVGCRMCQSPDDGKRYGAVFVVLDFGGAGAAGLHLETDYDYLFYGASAGDSVGSQVALVPDMNGDGASEILIGAPGEDTGGLGAGAAWLVTPLPADTEVELTTSTALLLTGEEAGDRAGSSVLGHDFDADGIGDLAVGAEQADGDSSLTGGGRVYVLDGAALESDGYLDASGTASGELDLSDADEIWGADGSHYLAGIELAAADFDLGSGETGVLAIGASQHDAQGRATGAVYLVAVE